MIDDENFTSFVLQQVVCVVFEHLQMTLHLLMEFSLKYYELVNEKFA
jgi:hypothetical protein